MKKIALSVIALAMAFSFTAASAQVVTSTTVLSQFNQNLTVGSRSADVSALQTILINGGYLAGVSTPTGYFGSLTKAALAKWQASVGITPAVGYFGMISRTYLNTHATQVGPIVTTPGCPVGAMFNSLTGAMCSTPTSSVGCPVGAMFNSMTGAMCGSTVNNTVLTGDGSLTASQSSFVSSGTQLKKGDTKNVLAIKLKATSGPVAVTRADVHFNLRPWLVFSQLTLKDSTGKLLATKTLTSASDATEITVGSDYLVRFENISETVNPGTDVELIVGATVLNATDKITNNQVVNVAFGINGIKTLNGKGDTDSVGGNDLSGQVSTPTATPQSGTGVNNFTLSSTGSVADITARISPSSPLARQQVTSLTQTTNDVVLGVIGLKSANNIATLNTLTIGVTSTAGTSTALSNVRLYDGSTSYGGTWNAGNTVTFSNLNLPLSLDTYKDFTIKTDVAASSTGVVAITLAPNTTNVVGIDANYNVPTVTGSTVTSNNVTLTVNALTVSNISATRGEAIVQSNSTVGYNITYKFTLTNTSNSDLFVSASSSVLVATSTTGTVGSSTLPSILTVSPSGLAADVSGVAYVIPAGNQSRDFTLTGALRGTTLQTVNLRVTQINYGTTSGTPTGSNINFGLENLVTTASF